MQDKVDGPHTPMKETRREGTHANPAESLLKEPLHPGLSLHALFTFRHRT